MLGKKAFIEMKRFMITHYDYFVHSRSEACVKSESSLLLVFSSTGEIIYLYIITHIDDGAIIQRRARL